MQVGYEEYARDMNDRERATLQAWLAQLAKPSQIRSTAAWLAVWTIGLGACLFLGWILLQRIVNTTGLWFVVGALPLAILALIAMICLYGMIVLFCYGDPLEPQRVIQAETCNGEYARSDWSEREEVVEATLDAFLNTIRGCQTCGYDLTGNTSGRCPECGTPTMDAAQSNNKAKP